MLNAWFAVVVSLYIIIYPGNIQSYHMLTFIVFNTCIDAYIHTYIAVGVGWPSCWLGYFIAFIYSTFCEGDHNGYISL